MQFKLLGMRDPQLLPTGKTVSGILPDRRIQGRCGSDAEAV